MAAHGERAGRNASLRLLTLYEEPHTKEFEIEYRGVTLSKTSDEKWTVKNDGDVLDEFSKTDFDGVRGWIDHINGLAQHGREYLNVVKEVSGE